MKILLLSPPSRCENVERFLLTKGNEVMTWIERIDPSFIAEHEIDFIVSHGYAPIIKDAVISAVKGRVVNIHNSFLPYGRGLYPILWGFFEKTPQGVSVHFINPGIDTGDIIARKQIEVDPGKTLQTIWCELMNEQEQLFFDVWDKIVKGVCARQPQTDFSQGSYHCRADSERLIRIFPKKWETIGLEVEKLGEAYLAAPSPELFWERFRV